MDNLCLLRSLQFNQIIVLKKSTYANINLQVLRWKTILRVELLVAGTT